MVGLLPPGEQVQPVFDDVGGIVAKHDGDAADQGGHADEEATITMMVNMVLPNQSVSPPS